MEFQSKIESFGENTLGYGPYITIPENIYFALLEKTKDKRVTCTLNNSITVSRALAKKDTLYYILLNKEVLKKINVSFDDVVTVSLVPDLSKYGVPMCEEMEEALFQDPDGSVLFEKLTPGVQRTMILLINNYKSSQLKIERSFIILEHLKIQKGKIDFPQLQQDFKNYKEKYKF